MTKQEIVSLLKRYESGTCNAKEKAWIEKWSDERHNTSNWEWNNTEEKMLIKKIMRSHIQKQLFPVRKNILFTSQKIAVAAVILICCLIGTWLYYQSYNNVGSSEQFYTQQAVKPGSSAALLTLADGSTIRLDDENVGTLFDKNGVAIKKLDNGELIYEVDKNKVSNEAGNLRSNTIKIPRGGQYQLTLPDGTKVRLNSASTLVYPSVFSGNERVVSLEGEAYFEVAKNKKQPFRVKAKDTEILVTGTHFNITAYDDETNVFATLIEGGVNVFKNNQSVKLVPGQQAITNSSTPYIDTKNVDIDYTLAWIYGDFLFEEQDIQSIMKKVARFYNVEVTYKGKFNPQKFGGTYTPSKGLEELLKHLESLSDIRFELKEGRVTVMM